MVPKILIIEDQVAVPILIEHWVATHAAGKLEVVRAMKLSTGIMLASECAVAILDLKLPDSPDHEETLKAIPNISAHCPVIILTGYEEPVPPRDRKLLGEAVADWGADSCLFKDMVLVEGMSGIDLLMFFVQSALYRRAFQNKTKT